MEVGAHANGSKTEVCLAVFEQNGEVIARPTAVCLALLTSCAYSTFGGQGMGVPWKQGKPLATLYICKECYAFKAGNQTYMSGKSKSMTILLAFATGKVNESCRAALFDM